MGVKYFSKVNVPFCSSFLVMKTVVGYMLAIMMVQNFRRNMSQVVSIVLLKRSKS